MGDKREFLMGCDYGGGGLYGVMNARSKNEITRAYPELVILDIEDPPTWMGQEGVRELRDREWHDIDGTPWGMLNALLSDRAKRDGRADS